MAKKIIFLSLFLITTLSLPSYAYKNTFIAAGTYLTVISPHKNAAQIVYKEFRRLDKLFNNYDAKSEISKINNSFKKKVTVSKDIIELLSLAKNFYLLSKGYLDVSCGKMFAFWKQFIAQKRKIFPSEKTINTLKDYCAMQSIKIFPHTVILNKKTVVIDFGAIAKGFMVDKAIKALKQKNIESALINAGGEIYCLGTNGKKPWKVGIRNPKNKKAIIKIIPLVNKAVATSGNYEQFFFLGGKKYSHIINPKEGIPLSNGIVSVTVIADSCVLADALATTFSIGGVKFAKEFVKTFPFKLRVFLAKQEKNKLNLYEFKN